LDQTAVDVHVVATHPRLDGEFGPTAGIVIELGPAIRALLRGDSIPPEQEEVEAEVPEFVPEDWGAPPPDDPLS
jgi:hypothetical protein